MHSTANGEQPTSFGRYKIAKTLGQGGMGTVYLAHDTQLDRPVALKVPRLDRGPTAQLRERFLREAQAAATLSHPNICPVYDVGEIDGKLYATMAYVEGKPLSDLIKGGKVMPQRAVAAVVRKLALALAVAHNKGVIHRDLKPANVMIDKKKEPIIMDFGLARRLDKEDIRLTGEGMILGTPAYMPPEQVRGETAAMGPSCDIYSLGVLLYEMLTGRLPFEGPVQSVLARILSETPPSPSQFRNDLDPNLESVCLKAMARMPEDRYRSMAEFASALTAFLHASSESKSVVGREETTTMPEAGTALLGQLLAAAPPDPTHPGSAPPRKNKLLIGGAGLLVAVALIVGLLWTRNQPSPSPTEVKVEIQALVLPVGPGLVIVLDGKEIDLEVLKAPLALKPGDHELELRLPGKEPQVRKFRVEPEDNGKKIAVLPPEPDGDVRLVQQFHVPQHSVWSMAFLPDNKLVSFNDPILVFDSRQANEQKRLRIKGTQVFRGAPFPDGRRYLVVGRQNLQQVALLISAEDGTIQRTINGPRGHDGAKWPAAAAVSTDGERFLVNFEDDLIRVYSVEREEAILNVEGRVACFSQDGTRLLTASRKTLLLFDAKDGKELKRFEGHENIITSVALTPDNRRAISASRDKSISVWDTETGKEIHSLRGHTGHVYGVAVSPDGRRLLSAGYTQDKTVRLWDLETGKELHVFRPQEVQITVAFSPGGKFGLSGGATGIWLWQLPP